MNPYRRLFLLSAFVSLLVLGWGCPGKNSPSSPAVPQNTPTPIPTPVFQIGIYCRGFLTGYRGISSGNYADLYLQANSQPVSDATAVLTGSNIAVPVTLAYVGPVTSGLVYSHYRAQSGWTYQAGQIYTLKAITSSGTDEATVAAPGGVTLSPDGTSVSWALEGNSDSVIVTKQGGSSTFFTTTDADSPVVIPSSAYPSSGTYRFTVSVGNLYSDTSGGTGSLFSVSESLEQDFVFNGTPTSTPTACRSCTPTGTPTFTPTTTPTETPSSTPTASSTDTPFPSETSTPTSSPTLTPTATPSFTASFSPTATPSPTPTETGTPTPLCTSPSYFGKGSGASSANFQNFLDASRYNLSAPGTVTALIAYLPAASGSIRMAIYSDTAGSPGSLLAQTSSQTVNLDTNILPLPSPLILPAGNYWLAYQVQGSSTIAYDAGAAGSEAYVTSFPYGPFPAAFPVFAYSNFNWYLEGRYCP